MLRKERQLVKKIADGLTLGIETVGLPLERRFSFRLPGGLEILSLNVGEIKRLPKCFREEFANPNKDTMLPGMLVVWSRRKLGREK